MDIEPRSSASKLPPLQMDGKVIVVTGAGSGIGRASAGALGRAGAYVMVSDIDQSAAASTVNWMREAGWRAEQCCGDVSDPAFADRLVEATLDVFGRLDGAHNNAGIEGLIRPIAEAEESDFDRVVAVNLKGTWLCMRAQIRHMLGHGGGAIVNTASVGGLTAVPGSAGYSAAKHGVIGLSRTAAIEYAMHGIRVNALCPGLTRSGLTDRLARTAPELISKVLPPIGRMAEPEEIAATVVHLLSDAATFITGQTIIVDGGAMAT